MSSILSYPLKIFKIPLWQQIVIALILGVALGLTFPDAATPLAPIGQLFINAIQLMVVPVVFVSITCGVLSLRGTTSMGRVTLKTMTLYMVTMAISATIGILVAEITQPGKGMDLSHLLNEVTIVAVPQPTLDNIITNLVPPNMFAAFSNNSTILQVIVVALIFGLAIMRAGENGQRIHHIFDNMFAVMMQFAQIIMKFAPIGVFCLMSVMISKFGTTMLLELLTMVLTIYAGCLIHALVVYSGMLVFISRLNPIRFFKGMADAMIFAFSTTSSAATLPIALRCTQKNLGVAKSISEFIMPLGASINMNGLTLYLGVAAVFASNLYGIELSMWQFILIIITSTVAAMGASGVPGSALFVMALVMSSIGIPLTVIGIIAAVDRIIDMMTTTTNITGDALTAVMVAKSENMLDVNIYNGKKQHKS